MTQAIECGQWSPLRDLEVVKRRELASDPYDAAVPDRQPATIAWRAADLAGMERVQLLFALRRFGISPIGVAPEELERDLENARR